MKKLRNFPQNSTLSIKNYERNTHTHTHTHTHTRKHTHKDQYTETQTNKRFHLNHKVQ